MFDTMRIITMSLTIFKELYATFEVFQEKEGSKKDGSLEKDGSVSVANNDISYRYMHVTAITLSRCTSPITVEFSTARTHSQACELMK